MIETIIFDPEILKIEMQDLVKSVSSAFLVLSFISGIMGFSYKALYNGIRSIMKSLLLILKTNYYLIFLQMLWNI